MNKQIFLVQNTLLKAQEQKHINWFDEEFGTTDYLEPEQRKERKYGYSTERKLRQTGMPTESSPQR